jgi:hypothetical protein
MKATVGITVSDGRLRFEIDGVQADAESGLRQLENLLAATSATARTLEAELPVALDARDAVALRHSRASQFPLSIIMSRRVVFLRSSLDVAEDALQQLAKRRNACSIALLLRSGMRPSPPSPASRPPMPD